MEQETLSFISPALLPLRPAIPSRSPTCPPLKSPYYTCSTSSTENPDSNPTNLEFGVCQGPSCSKCGSKTTLENLKALTSYHPHIKVLPTGCLSHVSNPQLLPPPPPPQKPLPNNPTNTQTTSTINTVRGRSQHYNLTS